jgi:hypothetical protein
MQMKARWSVQFSVIASAVLSLALPAHAQTPTDDGYDHTYDEIIGPQKLPDLFDPIEHGMEPIESHDQFYAQLIQPGRCPPGKTQRKRVPCAMISYAPPGTFEEAYPRSLRPVLKVESESSVWTFVNGGLVHISIDELWGLQDLSDPTNPERSSYDPTALVGYEENREHCATSRNQTCLKEEYFLFLAQQSEILTPGCVDEIWSRKGGATGAGAQSRCRFKTSTEVSKPRR